MASFMGRPSKGAFFPPFVKSPAMSAFFFTLSTFPIFPISGLLAIPPGLTKLFGLFPVFVKSPVVASFFTLSTFPMFAIFALLATPPTSTRPPFPSFPQFSAPWPVVFTSLSCPLFKILALFSTPPISTGPPSLCFPRTVK